MWTEKLVFLVNCHWGYGQLVSWNTAFQVRLRTKWKTKNKDCAVLLKIKPTNIKWKDNPVPPTSPRGHWGSCLAALSWHVNWCYVDTVNLRHTLPYKTIKKPLQWKCKQKLFYNVTKAQSFSSSYHSTVWGSDLSHCIGGIWIH